MNTHLFRDNFMYAGTSGLMAKILCAPLWLAEYINVWCTEKMSAASVAILLLVHDEDRVLLSALVLDCPVRRCSN